MCGSASHGNGRGMTYQVLAARASNMSHIVTPDMPHPHFMED